MDNDKTHIYQSAESIWVGEATYEQEGKTTKWTYAAQVHLVVLPSRS